MHLTGNLGITEKVVKYLHRRIRCAEPFVGEPIEDLSALIHESDHINKSDRSIQEIKADFKNLSLNRKRELVQENLKLKHIKRSIEINSHRPEMRVADDRKLEFIRQLGHKYDIPGSAQWHLHRDKENHTEDCWICGQWTYSLMFWSQSIGEAQGQDYKKISHECREHVAEKIRAKHPCIDPIDPYKPKDRVEERQLQQLTFYEEDETRPVICGEFTHWQPVRMLRIDEFAQSVDS